MLVAGLSKLGVKIDCEHIRYGSSDIFATKRASSEISQYDFVVNCVNKYEINPQYGQSQIVITACEAIRASDNVIAIASNTLDFWVPSNHSKQGLVNAGISQDILVLPHGVTPEEFDSRPKSTEGIFKFLFVASWEWRKCPDLILEAFLDEFKDDDLVHLIMKTKNTKQEINLPSELPERVTIIDSYLSRVELFDLYRSCHAYIGVTRGEGWGLPITEALMFGLPVIVTAWSAPLEYLDQSLNLFVSVDGFVHRPAPMGKERLTYAQPSYISLRKSMRTMRTNYYDQHAKMLRQREKLIEEYSWSKSAGIALDRLRTLSNKTRSCLDDWS